MYLVASVALPTGLPWSRGSVARWIVLYKSSGVGSLVEPDAAKNCLEFVGEHFLPFPEGLGHTSLGADFVSHQGVVCVETHPKLLESRQQLRLHPPSDGVVHALVHRGRLPSVRSNKSKT